MKAESSLVLKWYRSRPPPPRTASVPAATGWPLKPEPSQAKP